MRLVLTGGGTAGHIYPGLTLLRYMERVLDSVEVLYIGSENGLEKDLVGRTEIPFASIPAAGLKRQISLSGLKTAWQTYRGYRKARQLLRTFRPDVVVGTGGYVTLPVVFAAAAMKIPAVIWEGNARPGLTNQLCARKAYGVAVSLPGTERWFPNANRVMLTGNPRASEVRAVTSEHMELARRQYGVQADKKLILCFAGSRGSETVNDVLVQLVPRFSERSDWQFLYVTGEKHFETVRNRIAQIPANVQILPFIHDMPALLPQAHAVVTRAGSSTLAEICSFGVPSILIPSPYVTANHQEENAKRLVERGAARMIRESELTPEALWTALTEVLTPDEGERLRQAAKELGMPDAVERLYQLVQEAVANHRPGRR
jgi:UDP-N-acetylglucosamine--N-acetylmuramyl-(pentapeptide) pyrophosphoryl-undecaprenol N-acetylglucosamine transferase